MQILLGICVFSSILNFCLGDGDMDFVKPISRGERILIESKNYPEPIPPNTQMSWMIHCSQGRQIRLACRDVRLDQEPTGDCIEDKLTINDGRGSKVFCGQMYDYETVTTGNLLRVQLIVGKYESGGVSCLATVYEPPTERPVQVEPTQPTVGPPIETNIYLTPGGEEVKIQSPDYPASIRAQTHRIWRLTTDPGSTIRITCRDIRLHKPRDGECYSEEFVEMDDGMKVKKLCLVYGYSELTPGNTLNVRLMSLNGGGGMDCTVQGKQMDWYGEATTPKYTDISSEEVDSAEHGGPPGPKSTTCKCGWSNKANKRIVNGVESGINEHPYMVAIFKRNSGYNFCGGSILTPYHVLTAAHCTWRFLESDTPLSVYVGDHDLWTSEETNATQIINVARIIQHPSFHKFLLDNDIAVLLLEEKIVFNQFVGPVCLPHQGWFDLQKTYTKVVGWGLLSSGGSSPDRLQKVYVRVIDIKQCNDYWSQVSLENKTQICTYAHNKAPCQGDSGGPLLWLDPDTNRYTQVGVVSFSRVCADTIPTVYAAVASYVDWIHQQIRETIPHETCSKIN